MVNLLNLMVKKFSAVIRIRTRIQWAKVKLEWKHIDARNGAKLNILRKRNLIPKGLVIQLKSKQRDKYTGFNLIE